MIFSFNIKYYENKCIARCKEYHNYSLEAGHYDELQEEMNIFMDFAILLEYRLRTK